MKKYIAKQIDPEYQTSPWEYYENEDDFIIFGNRDFIEFVPDAYKDIFNAVKTGEFWRLSEKSDHVIESYENGIITDRDLLLSVLKAETGKTWYFDSIRGCCQSDWQYIVYIDSGNNERLNYISMDYFNTGTEYIITDPDGDETALYCYSYNAEGIRKEIADAFGIAPEDVDIYDFDGYTKTPKYKKVI